MPLSLPHLLPGLALALALAACTDPNGPERSDALIVRSAPGTDAAEAAQSAPPATPEEAFERGVFLTDQPEAARKAPVVTRWERRPEAFVLDLTGPEMPLPEDVAALAEAGAHYLPMTGLAPGTADGPPAEIRMIITPPETVARMAERLFGPGMAALRREGEAPDALSCFANLVFDTSRPGVIAGAAVVVSGALGAERRANCFRLGMLLALRPSASFVDGAEDFSLDTPPSRAQEVQLRMLYDPALAPGMTLEQARPLLPAVAARALLADRAAHGGTPALP
ncbi:hypothetical protein [Oceanicella sp. SM1341]|uniref:hypothetical protein n=1 Tax=Oceanicella sp. SM1341 TaxID=1548889 RepID=UPI000E50C2C6|nr:hypothetical protein [Oceanicella sp. SM1341]